jgi:hypothetical protein
MMPARVEVSVKRLHGIVAAIVLLSGDAAGQTLEDKLCIFKAAQKLPLATGLIVSAGRVRTNPVAEAARIMAGTRYDDTAGLAEQFSNSGLTDRRTLDLITRALERGDREAAVRTLEAGLATGITNTRTVEFDVTLAGLQATYAFVCATARDTLVRDDTLYVHTVGMVR